MARKLQLIGNFLSGEIDPDKVKALVDEYLDENPPSAGADGVSPTIAVEEIEGGHRIIITDVNGTQSFDVSDGSPGTSGGLSYVLEVDDDGNLFVRASGSTVIESSDVVEF